MTSTAAALARLDEAHASACPTAGPTGHAALGGDPGRLAAVFAGHFGERTGELPLQAADQDSGDIRTALDAEHTYSARLARASA